MKKKTIRLHRFVHSSPILLKNKLNEFLRSKMIRKMNYILKRKIPKFKGSQELQTN